MKKKCQYLITACPRSSYQYYIVSYFIKWVTISWTYSMFLYISIQEKTLFFIKQGNCSTDKGTKRMGDKLMISKRGCNWTEIFFCELYYKGREIITAIIAGSYVRVCHWRDRGVHASHRRSCPRCKYWYEYKTGQDFLDMQCFALPWIFLRERLANIFLWCSPTSIFRIV